MDVPAAPVVTIFTAVIMNLVVDYAPPPPLPPSPPRSPSATPRATSDNAPNPIIATTPRPELIADSPPPEFELKQIITGKDKPARARARDEPAVAPVSAEVAAGDPQRSDGGPWCELGPSGQPGGRAAARAYADNRDDFPLPTDALCAVY